MENKFKDWFINNIIYFIIIAIAVVYLFTAIFEIAETGKSIQDIILSSALILVIGYIVTALFDIQGIFKGGKTKEVKDVKNNHENTVLLVEPYANDLDGFCEEENSLNLKQTRTRYLAKAGLNYEDCFNKNSSAKKVKFEMPKKPTRDKKKTRSEWRLVKLEYREKVANVKFKKKMFKQAVRVKLTQVSTQSLISNGTKTNDKFDFGDTQKDYLRKSNIYSFFSKLIVAGIFGYYTIQLINDFSWSFLLWNALQVITFMAFGIIKYFQAYMFMQNNYVDRVKKQINVLKKFYNSKKGITPQALEKLLTEQTVNAVAEKVAQKFETE